MKNKSYYRKCQFKSYHEKIYSLGKFHKWFDKIVDNESFQYAIIEKLTGEVEILSIEHSNIEFIDDDFYNEKIIQMFELDFNKDEINALKAIYNGDEFDIFSQFELSSLEKENILNLTYSDKLKILDKLNTEITTISDNNTKLILQGVIDKIAKFKRIIQ